MHLKQKTTVAVVVSERGDLARGGVGFGRNVSGRVIRISCLGEAENVPPVPTV